MAYAYRQIMARCAAEHGVAIDDILGRSTRPDILAARYAALAECRRSFPDVSHQRLASWFLKTPRWTLYALRRIAGETVDQAKAARAA